VRSRKIANELARDGLTPLQVMINTMRELCQQAANAPTAAERIEKKLAACAVAKDAAPYIHPSHFGRCAVGPSLIAQGAAGDEAGGGGASTTTSCPPRLVAAAAREVNFRRRETSRRREYWPRQVKPHGAVTKSTLRRRRSRGIRRNRAATSAPHNNTGSSSGRSRSSCATGAA
jgi:hypothetical protein